MEYSLVLGAVTGAYLLRRLQIRLRLSRAKHRSLAGHARLSRLLARQLPYYGYSPDEAFACDGADAPLRDQRRRAFENLSNELRNAEAKTIDATNALAPAVSDMQFTNMNRVPFQFRELVNQHFLLGAFADQSSGTRLRDLDGNWCYDVGGSYGVNLLGYDFYKQCVERGVEKVRELGPVLGPYHPIIADNVEKIRALSGQQEVSFHMSGTEAVMQAVRLARFHTRRKQLVVACGAYHGWWDGVQSGIGHRRSVSDIYMLKDQSEDTLHVLQTRDDIACILVNPLQALHPNSGAASDTMLIDSSRHAGFDKVAYTDWLQRLRRVCSARGIVLIFDEVFVGFRLGPRGAQGFFDVDADMVTYGKTIGGGLPVGVLAGRADLMRRFRPERPADVCFARGTFNSQPYVMAAMNEFLQYASSREFAQRATGWEQSWNARIAKLNARLRDASLPVRLRNLVSICIVEYTTVSRFNWMLQFYLRAEGLALSWVGTGRFIFSHNFDDADFDAVANRILRATERMNADGWWSTPANVTNKAIRKRVFRELLANRFG